MSNKEAHSLDSERVVLGYLMSHWKDCEDNCIDYIEENLVDYDFYEPFHGNIFSRIFDMINGGFEIDEIKVDSVCKETISLGYHGEVPDGEPKWLSKRRVDLEMFLAKMVDYCYRFGCVKAHVDIIKARSEFRKVQKAANATKVDKALELDASERYVLKCLLSCMSYKQFYETFESIRGIIDYKDFSTEAYRHIYWAIGHLCDEERSSPKISDVAFVMGNKIDKKYLPTEYSGIVRFLDDILCDDLWLCPDCECGGSRCDDIKHHAEIIKEASEKRKLKESHPAIEELLKYIAFVENSYKEGEERFNECNKEIAELRKEQGEISRGRAYDSKIVEQLKEAVDILRKAYA